jgi:hypothetical protein
MLASYLIYVGCEIMNNPKAQIIAIHNLYTMASRKEAFQALGITPSMALIVHSSLKPSEKSSDGL